MEMDPTKVAAVSEWPTPGTIKRLQRLLGFANFYRRLIRGFSQIAAPLTSLTSKSMSFKWTPEADAAFRLLKNQLVSAPILTQPDLALQFVVEVDASNTG